MYVCMHAWMYVCMHVCTQIYVDIYIHTHTYLHLCLFVYSYFLVVLFYLFGCSFRYKTDSSRVQGLRLMFRVLGCGNGGFELSWAAVESLVKKWGKGREWIHGWRFRA